MIDITAAAPPPEPGNISSPLDWEVARCQSSITFGCRSLDVTLRNGRNFTFREIDFHAHGLSFWNYTGVAYLVERERLKQRALQTGGARAAIGVANAAEHLRTSVQDRFDDWARSRGAESPPKKEGKQVMNNYLEEYSRLSGRRSRYGYKGRLQTEGEVSMLREFKAYLSEHRDIVFTLLLIIVVDTFFFDGAFKTRIKGLLEGVVRKAESKLNKDLDGDGKVGE